ncbi:uncharacterized protein LOC112553160 isoform X1 [Pomacea canaliculata]|uniref:uncharacterized protein LOC112553160 isoform X1 n=1 Tax=Pomacea canaliculata TaxID=400727 RepID=UPI000D72CCEE|nr:uncharacterized protein LOC112553160 isoform X1 [Pomacea canaliculata]XP_025075982.1 uncharacterized protein LOC112553160 isoform X1 [Pomacea canaliculata]
MAATTPSRTRVAEEMVVGVMAACGGWCEMSIKVCSTCKIRLSFLALSFPACNSTATGIPDTKASSRITTSSRQICIPGCDHIHLHEVDYPYDQASHANYFGDGEGQIFTSISSHVRLRHCTSGSPFADGKRFNIEFLSLDKSEIRQGMVAQEGNSFGTVQTPNFPQGYALNGETFTYVIQNLDPYGHVRFMATDWDIAPESEVKVYDGFGEKAPSLVLERFRRPVFVSQSNTLVFVFSTGFTLRDCCYHTGFKASYEFVSERAWPQRPITDCSAFYPMRGGGMIDFTGATTSPSLYDCVWVIKRQSSDNRADGVVLRLTEVLLGDGWLQFEKQNSLEIYDGTTSEAPVMYRYTAKNLTHALPSYFASSGLYIRLKGGFYSTDKLSFIFTAVKNVSLEGTTACPGLFYYPCRNLLCIDQDLMCDGIDHCGDESDESPALDCSMSALWRLSFKWSMPYVEPTTLRTTTCAGFVCRVDGRCLATMMRCDGAGDCIDGEDEQGCTTTDAFSSGRRLLANAWAVLFMIAISTSHPVLVR